MTSAGNVDCRSVLLNSTFEAQRVAWTASVVYDASVSAVWIMLERKGSVTTSRRWNTEHVPSLYCQLELLRLLLFDMLWIIHAINWLDLTGIISCLIRLIEERASRHAAGVTITEQWRRDASSQDCCLISPLLSPCCTKLSFHAFTAFKLSIK